jgi:hypothetical protein
MSFAAVSLLFIAAAAGQINASSGSIKPDELSYQQQAFKQWWEQDLVIVRGLAGGRKNSRHSHSLFGHYPDKSGTIGACKYDALSWRRHAEEYGTNVGARGRYGFTNTATNLPRWLTNLLADAPPVKTPLQRLDGCRIRHAEPEKASPATA